ncbi:DUF6461 domain-containing protein [Streptomyces yaizuensis]|uniref:DUF6461 domain-containing protein n=1 Tax=Streptomyces yaizuensis TaxID=2989713 RepID=A0ABQ5P6P2_9ACTN|nr:DUF6461 domain-containing protein [Streptomyces sp. YSPA8]GLF98247.1 DUF6461 domain-containing protein [Streptomyces sp. YSPA8]
MISAIPADYSWISPSAPFGYALGAGYSLVLVRGIGPEKLLRHAGAEPDGRLTGFDAVAEEHAGLLDEYDGWPDSTLAGVAAVPGEGGEWTLALELGGDTLGLNSRFMEAVSAGTRAVSVTGNASKPMSLFHWYEDGALRTGFEHPARRDGATPETLTTLITAVGLNPAGDEAPGLDRTAAFFALAERLTGIRITEELLARFTCRTGLVSQETHDEEGPSL